MLDTATAVYEAVEPLIIWKILFTGLKAAPDDQGSHVSPIAPLQKAALTVKPSELFAWVLSSIRQHEEEVVSLHIPIVLDSILDDLGVSWTAWPFADEQSAPSQGDTTKTQLALQLLKLIPESFWTRSAAIDDTPPIKDEEAWTTQVYQSANPPLADLMERARATLPSHIVSKVFQLSSKSMSDDTLAPERLLIVFEMVHCLLDHEPPSLKDVRGRAWIGSIVKRLSNIQSFSVVDAMISSVLKATRSSAFKSHFDQSHSSIMTVMLDTVSPGLGIR